MTALTRHSPSGGPALSFSANIPDLDHYKGSFGGRVFPLWRDHAGTEANVPSALLAYLSARYSQTVKGDDLLAYIAAIAAHPTFVTRFAKDLVQPGLRIPLTADSSTFVSAVEVGRRVIWLHSFGERFTENAHDRPASAPRMSASEAPRIPADGAIPPGEMPELIEYDPTTRRLSIGRGFIENVSPEMWDYEVSGKQVVRQWFSYRGSNRERPTIGDKRAPSPLGRIQPDHWLAEYTTELLNVLNVLGLLIALEPEQAELLRRVCEGTLITIDELESAGALAKAASETRTTRKRGGDAQTSFLS
jgi:hypothetical protein